MIGNVFERDKWLWLLIWLQYDISNCFKHMPFACIDFSNLQKTLHDVVWLWKQSGFIQNMIIVTIWVGWYCWVFFYSLGSLSMIYTVMNIIVKITDEILVYKQIIQAFKQWTVFYGLWVTHWPILTFLNNSTGLLSLLLGSLEWWLNGFVNLDKYDILGLILYG